MKVLFEVTLESHDYRKLQFEWLSDASNRLFVIEDGKRLRTISIGAEPGKVLESANLADGRVCTSFSWNKDGNQLAMVVDRRLIYFWDVRDNNLLHYKPSFTTRLNDAGPATAKNKPKDVKQIVWSKITNKVVIGYCSGQLLLCNCDSSLSETFIDNCDGLLREVTGIESSPHMEVFACISVIFELLVMTFDGDLIFYNQSGNHTISIIKFSPPLNTTASDRRPSAKQPFWLAYNNGDTQIYFKLVSSDEQQPAQVYPRDSLDHGIENQDERIIYHEWINSTSLIACLTSGIVSLIEIKIQAGKPELIKLISTKLLELHLKEPSVTDIPNHSTDCGPQDRELFRSFEIIGQFGNKSENKSKPSFSFSAMTKYRLFYYELLEMDDDACRYKFEKIDELDLTGSLRRIELNLERTQWSPDSSMLAVQLSNGHILIYRTRLQDHMVTSCGSRTAYLSESNEITILNYGLISGFEEDGDDSGKLSRSPTDKASSGLELTSKASIIKADMKPSVIAIGPKHLAIGLNNLVSYYATNDGKLKIKEEYHSIVSSICLGSRFVGVQFNDGRVKLHPLKEPEIKMEDATGVSFLNERYFPDPSKSETISAFTLTDEVFLYCTTGLTLNVFSLDKWTHLQSCNYHKDTNGKTITKLLASGRGNKYLCLTTGSQQTRCKVFLYDGYRNEIISFLRENKLYTKIFNSQLNLVPTLRHSTIGLIENPRRRAAPYLGRVSDVIWDTDGRSALLVEKRHIHIFAILDHTLETEGSIIEWVATIDKQSTYEILYASHGVVSFQTSLGRVINSICESHDDEAKLYELSQQIRSTIGQTSSDCPEVCQADIMRLKLDYLRTIVLVYPLSKCAEICEYIMTDGQFNVAEESRLSEIDDILWRQLAARALFTSNLQFALLVYKRRRLQVFSRALAEIMADSGRFGFDSKISVTNRLLIMLGCDIEDK